MCSGFAKVVYKLSSAKSGSYTGKVTCLLFFNIDKNPSDNSLEHE